MTNGNEPGNGNEPYENSGEGLDSGTPAVASSRGKVFAVLATAVGVIGFILYSLFSGHHDKPVENKRDSTIADSQTVITTPPPPEPPTPPTPVPEPPPVPQPPAPPSMPDVNFPDAGNNVNPGVNDEARKQRLHAPMLLMNSPSAPAPNEEAAKLKAQNAIASSDPNSAFAQNAIASSKADKAEATNIGDLRITVAQGKIIDAVLESAINTDLPSTLRAIVSRDVYPEAGRDPIIPKGSRLIGNYNTGILRGQTRVFIVWTRVIRPDGIDVAIGSPGIDSLGRGGMGGDVDNKYLSVFTGAALTSAFSIGVAVAGEKIVGGSDQVTTQTSPNGTTQTASPGAQATQQAVEQIGEAGKSVVKNLLDMRPTITVPQGTHVDVMVNRDLSFPTSVLNNTRFVQ